MTPQQPNKTLHPGLDFESLPKGQRRVAEALVGEGRARTYKGIAKQLELSLGTVYEHLRRIRLNHPELYAGMMIIRKDKLELRHKAALARDAEHTRRYFRRRSEQSLLERLESLLRYARKG